MSECTIKHCERPAQIGSTCRVHVGQSNIEIEDIDDLVDRDDPPSLFEDDDLVQTPMGGRLVLNPKVKKPGKNPLCPDCEQEIRRDETSNGLVEFVCGCEDLRHFEFKERGEG